MKAKVKDSYQEIFSNLTRILVVLAHPDDMEITCGGTIARLTGDNKQVRLVVTTNGGKGMKDKKGLKENEFGQKRIKEQIEAGKVLGIQEKENFNLQIPDGELQPSIENIGKIAFHIRQFRPDIVITHNPQDSIIKFYSSYWVNHRDHRNTGQLTLDAVYPFSRDRGFFPNHFTKSKLGPHVVDRLLLADSYTKEEVRYINIDKVLDKKRQALKMHPSALDPNDADDYISENKMSNGFFEPLGYYKVY